MKKTILPKTLRIMISAICVVCSLIVVVLLAVATIISLDIMKDARLRNSLYGLFNSNGFVITLIIAASVIIATLIGYLLSKALSNRIAAISRHVQRLTAGNYDSRVEGDIREGELGSLAEATNELGERLSVLRREAASEKRKSQILLEHMHIGVVAFNENGKLVFINPSAGEMAGIGRNAPIYGITSYEETFGQILSGTDFDGFKSLCTNRRRQIVHLNDKVFSISFDTLKEASGLPFRGVAFIVDRSAEAELEAKQSDFVANASHELKTPLTIIKTYTETLLDGTVNDPDAQRQMLEKVDFEADRMTRMVRDLLQLSRLSSGKDAVSYKRMRLKPLIDTIISRSRDAARGTEKSIELEYAADPDLVVSGDYTKLETIFLNVMSNSLKYTADDGHIKMLVCADDENVHIEVSDNGIGVKKEDLSRIFDRFFRADNVRGSYAKGTGLGLPIAKEYVDAHGGTIEVQSTVNQGTTIIIDLPIVVKIGEEND